MKKKNLLLALLSSSLILASCNDDKTDSKDATENGTSQADDSSATSGDPTGTSEPEISVDTRTNAQKVNELFALMAEGKTSTFEYEGFKTEYLGNDKGIWTTVPANDQGYTDYGTAVIPNYGIFNVEYDDDTNEMYLSSIITPNTALKIGDVAYTTKDLGEAAAAVTWTESSRTHTFSTTDSTFNAVMMCMLGLNEYVGLYANMKTSFLVNDAGTALTSLSLALTNGTSEGKALKDISVDGMKISKVGETVNLDMLDLIANAQITNKTGWTQYETAYFTTYIHAQFALPFPTGASYAFTESVTENKQFLFTDYGSGNLVNSYKAQLEAAGFTLNTEKSDLTTGIYCYEKTLVAATASSPAIKEYVMFTWNNAAQQAQMYPNGAFVILAYVAREIVKVPLADAMTLLRSHTLSNGTQYWPAMNIQNCTGAEIDDQTEEFAAEYAGYYDEEFAATIKLYFATEAEAQAALAVIEGQLSKTYSYSSSYGVYYLQGGDSYTIEEVDVTVKIAYDESGNYLGYIVITIDSYSYEDYYY